MKPSLSQIQARLAGAEELREAALMGVRLLALGRLEADKAARLEIVSKFDAIEHEYWLLVKIEREMIASGRDGMEQGAWSMGAQRSEAGAAESHFNASALLSAVLTPPAGCDAAGEIRGGTRGPVADSPVPKAVPVLPVASPGGPPPANLRGQTAFIPPEPGHFGSPLPAAGDAF